MARVGGEISQAGLPPGRGRGVARRATRVAGVREDALFAHASAAWNIAPANAGPAAAKQTRAAPGGAGCAADPDRRAGRGPALPDTAALHRARAPGPGEHDCR